MEVDGFVMVSQSEDMCDQHLREIYDYIDSLEDLLCPLNSFIHDNPELAYKEYKAHDALTDLMQSQEGWTVTESAYGIKTAWMAVYDTGRPGPVVSFNAEMGTFSSTFPLNQAPL